ncbi:MAG TPA: hypothetical protein H9740_05765 [Candidatus Hungatella pullicola]|nr:hypothetical protein [Candidatus Hungatella pullicola]
MICKRCGRESKGEVCEFCGFSNLTVVDEQGEILYRYDSVQKNSAAEPDKREEGQSLWFDEEPDTSKKAGNKGNSRSRTAKGRRKVKVVHKTKVKKVGQDHKWGERQGTGELKKQEVKKQEFSWLHTFFLVISRILQLICASFMAVMTLLLAWDCYKGYSALGSISAIAAERNYTLALYLGLAGCLCLWGTVSFFWIISKRSFSNGQWLVKHDTGRGLTAFFCTGAFGLLSGMALSYIPHNPAALEGLTAILKIGAQRREDFILISLAGLILCIIRKLMRV